MEVIGDGDGVLASGESGMWPTDFLLGEWNVCVSLCFRPWRELGRGKWGRWVELAGELGTLELGELLWEEFPVE